jgi:membrane associated rhomboid family serine protease
MSFQRTLRDANSFLDRHLTPGTKLIFLVNILVFLGIVLLLPIFRLSRQFVVLFAQIPALAIYGFQVWRFVTYMFVHASGMHVLLNMLMLWFFAPPLEMRWGKRGFLKFYFVTGVGAGIIHAIFCLITGQMGQAMIGASGAIYGILLAFALLFPDQVVLLYFFIPIKVKYLVIILGALEFFGSVGSATGLGYGDNISHITHLGGLAVAYMYLRGDRVLAFVGLRRRPGSSRGRRGTMFDDEYWRR